MTRLTRRTWRSALSLVALAAGSLLFASSALGIDAPGGLSASPGNPTKADAVTVTWNPSIPVVPTSNVTYQGGLDQDPAGAPTEPVTSGQSVSIPSGGTFYFHVKAIEDDGVLPTESGYSTVTIVADRTGPTLGITLLGTPSASGWYRDLKLHFEPCTDDVAISAAACADQTWTKALGEGAITGAVREASDVAGNPASATAPDFKFDVTPPSTAPGLTGPGPLVSDQPTFRWTPAKDATSNIDGYRVEYQDDETFTANGWTTLATVKDTGGNGEYSAPHSVWPDTLLPENTLLDWRVVAVDLAGNERASSGTGQKLTIDPTVPPKPTIISGPSAPSQNTSPTFTWDGTGTTFSWKVTPIGSPNAIRSGAGGDKEATLRSLTDGTYVFHVTQFTPADRESEEATQSFTIDTTPPDPPGIVSRPTFPTIATAVFTWNAEPGAYSRWVVIGSNGAAVVGPIDSVVTRAELPPLADGAYTFQVQQVDGAGNISSPTSEPFTVLAPLVPAPSVGGGTITALALPKQNASRLQPKAGTTVPTLAPVLRWTRGPRGTKLYNLQIFQVTRSKKAGANPKVTKIYSSFPRGLQARAPKAKLKAGTCYVWRIWPYTGQAFAPKPVGISNFCTASAKVIRLKQKQAAARARAARARAARARR